MGTGEQDCEEARPTFSRTEFWALGVTLASVKLAVVNLVVVDEEIEVDMVEATSRGRKDEGVVVVEGVKPPSPRRGASEAAQVVEEPLLSFKTDALKEETADEDAEEAKEEDEEVKAEDEKDVAAAAAMHFSLVVVLLASRLDE